MGDVSVVLYMDQPRPPDATAGFNGNQAVKNRTVAKLSYAMDYPRLMRHWPLRAVGIRNAITCSYQEVGVSLLFFALQPPQPVLIIQQSGGIWK